MKLLVKVKGKHGKEDLKTLIQAFFSETSFKPENKLEIKGDEARLEVFFDKVLSKSIVEAINNCEVIELIYGEVGEKHRETPKPRNEVKGPRKGKGRRKVVDLEEVQISELEEIANKATSFEHFVKLVAEWLNLKTHQQFFEKVAIAATEVENVCWNELENMLRDKGVSFNQGVRDQTVAKVYRKIEKYSITFLVFLKAVGQYKTYSFGGRDQPEPEDEEEEEEPHNEPEPEDEKPRKQSKRKGKPKVMNPEEIDIPELKEMLEKATSFEHFVKLVAVWLEMGVREDFFKKLVDTSIKIEDISWAKIAEALKNRGVVYSNWDKIVVSRQVANKLEKYSVTMISFLLVMKHYRNSFFIQFDEEHIVSAEEETSDEVASPTPVKVKMECMPEICSFEKVLKTVDRTQPIEERVKHVLTAMGWDKKHSKEKNMIFEVVNVAVRVEDMSAESILGKVNIPKEDKMFAWMSSAKFINDFVKPYYPNFKVKLLDFFKELQEIVVLESEIESSTA